MEKLSKAKWCLLGCLIIILVFIVGSVFAPNSVNNAVRWIANNEFTYKLRGLSEREAVEEGTLTEMVVDRVVISKISYQPVVILKEKDGELYLPIQIGFPEASAISVVLEGVEVARPLTPDLLCSVLDETEASVDYIVINDLKNDVFYANIIVIANWTQTEIDARPSDAIAIALRVRAPIYVEKSVLNKAGIQPESITQEV